MPPADHPTFFDPDPIIMRLLLIFCIVISGATGFEQEVQVVVVDRNNVVDKIIQIITNIERPERITVEQNYRTGNKTIKVILRTLKPLQWNKIKQELSKVPEVQ